MSEIMEIGGVALGMLSVILCLWGALNYVLTAISHHRIASRRGLGYGILAWIPLANIWLHGKLSDHFQYVKAGRRTKRAGTLLTLTILSSVVLALAITVLSSVAEYLSRSRLEPGSLLGLILGILLMIAGAGLCLAWRIVGYVSDYSIYNSCNPDSAKSFLVLGIFFPVLTPFFRLGSSGRDDGMPHHYNS